MFFKILPFVFDINRDMMQPYGNEYLTQAVLTATPLELTRMLYQGGLSAVENAVANLRSGDIMERGRCISKAINIVLELRAGLDESQPELYRKLGDLYTYMHVRLQQAHIQASEPLLHEMAKLFRSLLEGARTATLTASRQHYEAEPQIDNHPRFQDTRDYAYSAAMGAYGSTPQGARNWQG